MHNALRKTKMLIFFYLFWSASISIRCDETDGNVTGVFNQVFFFPRLSTIFRIFFFLYFHPVSICHA